MEGKKKESGSKIQLLLQKLLSIPIEKSLVITVPLTKLGRDI